MLLRRSIVILRKSPEAGDCLHHPHPTLLSGRRRVSICPCIGIIGNREQEAQRGYPLRS
jgi:hypothetical protein